MTGSFFDGFFFVVSILVLGVMFTDWWIGREGRVAIKNRVADWWVYVEHSSYQGLVADDAARVRRGLELLFGAQWYRPRAIVLVAILSLLITNAAFLLAHSVIQADLIRHFYDTNSKHYPYPPWPIYVLKEGFRSAFNSGIYYPSVGRYLPINVLADLISLYATIHLLRAMERRTDLGGLMLLIAVDIAIVFVLTALVFDIGTRITWFVHPNYLADLSTVMRGQYLLLAPQKFYEYAVLGGPPVGGLLAKAALIGVLISSGLPSILHIGMGALFLVSKLTRPVIKPILARTLLRVAESEKGVLTQVALFGGAIAKAFQEGMKLFG
jgi:hypothetical protein